MKKKTIALVAAVALVVLAVPTLAFANVMHNPFASSNSTAPAIRVLDSGQNAQGTCPGYADTDNNGMCDKYDQGACPGYHDQDGDGVCDTYGQGGCPNGVYNSTDDNTGVDNGQGYGQGRHHGGGHGNGHHGNGGAGYGCMRG